MWEHRLDRLDDYLRQMQRGVEGAGFDLEQVVGLRADGLSDSMAVLGPPLQGPEDEHVEGPLEELQALFVQVFGHSRRRSTALDVGCLRLVPISRVSQTSPLFQRLSCQRTNDHYRLPATGLHIGTGVSWLDLLLHGKRES